MVSWGILAGIESQIQGPTSFYVLRFLLGAAEAGFFPGVILYLSYWFPARPRAAAVSLFMASAPLSTALDSPLASTILGLNGALGLAGWQWLFILEAIPSVLLGFVTLATMTDRPEQAKWCHFDGIGTPPKLQPWHA
jgi:ACS family tartrate transporter-like MFS transporter